MTHPHPEPLPLEPLEWTRTLPTRMSSTDGKWHIHKYEGPRYELCRGHVTRGIFKMAKDAMDAAEGMRGA